MAAVGHRVHARWGRPPLYVRGRDPRVDWVVRVAVVAGSVSLGVYGAVAAVTGLGAPGPGTTALWLLTAIAAVSSVIWICTPRILSGTPAAVFAGIADVTVAGALSGLRDPELTLFGCVLFALHASYVAMHVPSVGLAIHLVFVTTFVSWAGVHVVLATDVSPVTATIGTTALLWGLVGVPLIVRQVWVGLSRVAESASYDPLTGLLNRGGLERRHRRLAATAAGDGVDVLVVVVDLDRFKAVNDRYGHGVGDAVLVEAARHLTEHFGYPAAVARTGGEEFTVVAIGPRAHLARTLAEMRTSSPGVHGPPATMSVGAVWCRDLLTPRALDRAMTAADHAMYAAKAAGGDRIHLVDDAPLWPAGHTDCPSVSAPPPPRARWRAPRPR